MVALIDEKGFYLLMNKLFLELDEFKGISSWVIGYWLDFRKDGKILMTKFKGLCGDEPILKIHSEIEGNLGVTDSEFTQYT